MLSRIACVVVMATVSVMLGWCQETRGTIVGRVTDSSGGSIAGAEVVVSNQETGTTVTLRTAEDGLYTAPLLLPGTYQVSASASGFKNFTRKDVTLQVADRLEVNATLELGSNQQTVTVTGTPELLSTETASMGSVISAKQIADLPLSYGNPFALIGLASGTTFTGNPRLDRPFEPTHIVGYSIDGTRSNRSDVTLDGSPASATADAGQVIASYVPTTEMLSEFKVQTVTFDAAMGNTEGGVTNLSTKYGTNDWHGRAYYSITRKQFWANDLFNKALGKERPDFRFNRWGGVLGGPIFIPKLYNGKNRTFFFAAYEAINDSRPRYDSTSPQVPTPAMKNGDFSSLLALGPQYQIYNPYTRRQSGSRFVEQPFVGNIIPANLWNPVGKAILDRYYANPVSPGNPDGSSNYVRPELAERADYYNYSVRLDQNVGEKQRMYGRFSNYRRDSTYNDYFGNPSTGTFFQFFSKNFVYDDTIILSPTTVLDLRYGYNRFIRGSDGNQSAKGFDLTSLGLPASYNNLIPADIRRFPRIDLAGYISTGFTGEYRPVDTHAIAATLNKTARAHSLRGGVDFRAYRETDSFFSNDQTGRFNFDSSYTRGPNDNSPSSPNNFGQSVAALLLGLPSSTNSYVARAANYAEQSMTWGLFFQDDWKVTSRLTLNLGLRWEFENPLTERFNRSAKGFDPNYVQPFNNAALAAYARNPLAVPLSQFGVRGGLTFAGLNGQSRQLYNAPLNNLLPRFGFAYQFDPSTVIRGGFGIYQGFLGERRGDVTQPGYSQNTPFVPFAPNGTTIISTLSNPFPNGIIEPVGNAAGYQTFLGQNITFFNQNPKMPKMNRWQIDIQRQFPGAVLLEVGYIGNKGTGIEINRNINALPDQYLSTLNARDNVTNNFLTAAIANPFVGLLPSSASSSFTSSTIGRQQLLLPFPEFGTITTSTNEGYSWYHSLQVHADKRFNNGLNVIFNYTFSKFMQATELLNAGDPAPTRMISDLDSPHRFSSAVIYNLPFGRGRQFLSHTNRWVDGVFGGWEVTGLWAMQSGLPLNFSSNDYFFSGTGAPNVVLPADQRTTYQWFNTSAFVTNTALQPVSHLRVNPYRFATLRGPRTNNVDISVLKDFHLFESNVLRFSAQALNALNHPLYPTPNLNPTQSSFGTSFGSSNQANYPRRLQLELKYIF